MNIYYFFFFYNNINIKCILYQQEIATNTRRSTDVNPDVNHAWLGSIWPSAGFVPKSAGFSAELIPLAMLEVPFLPDCVAIKKFQRKNGTNLILSPVHIIYLLALSLKLFYLQTSMSCSWKWQNMQFFAFFLFGVDSIQKNRGKCATTKYSLACKFLCFFLFEIYLPIFNYFLIYIYKKIAVFCYPFWCKLIKVFSETFTFLDFMQGSIIFARKCTKIAH